MVKRLADAWKAYKIGKKTPMRKAVLTRIETGDEGTFGKIVTDSLFQCYTVELPWRGNAPEKSCIPAGVYVFKRVTSPKHGPCYEAEKVPGRTNIQIHSANWAGDADKGFFSELLGCIAPGRAILGLVPPKTGKKQKGVSSSKDALKGLENDLDFETFELTVRWHGENPECPSQKNTA